VTPDQTTIDEFHKLLYDSALTTWASTYWLGVQAEKYPCDLWIYQEIITELKPDIIVETGTRFGGSALFMASICDLLGQGQVITVDIEALASSPTVRPPHPRVTYLTGSSTSPDVLADIRARVEPASCVMVILDSDHTMTHVLDEMKLYADLVTTDSYMIVEDTNINGHPVASSFGRGPMEAVQVFLAGTEDFLVDRSREKLLLSFNPGGFLRKVTGGGVRSRLLAAEGRLEQLQEEVATQTARADEAKRQLLDEVAAETARADEAKRQLLDEVAAETARADEARQLIEERDAIIVEKEQGLVRSQEQLAQADSVRQAVEHSASWRLTEPLRGAKRFLKGG
jgi:cephalosporin hydroxylase